MAKTEEVKVVTVIDGSQSEKTLRDLREEVKQYRDQLVNLDRTSKEYNQTLNAYGQVQGKINDIMIDGRAAANAMDGSFNNLVTVSRTLAAGFSSLQGVTALLGSENKALDETFVKLQASMNLFISLSRFNANAIKQTTVAFQTLTRAMLANPYVLIATLIASLVLAFRNLSEEFEFITKPLKELFDGFNDLLKPIGGVSGAFDQLKAVIAGIGTTIVRFYSGPIKSLIKLFKGDLDGALEEAKNGFNFLSNAVDGYNNSIGKANNRAALKELDSQIEKYASFRNEDIKYNGHLQSLYDQRVDMTINAFGLESDEYKKALDERNKFFDQSVQYRDKLRKHEETKNQEQLNAAKQRFDEYKRIQQGYRDSITSYLTALDDEREAVRINELAEQELNQELIINKQTLEDIESTLRSGNLTLADRARLVTEGNDLLIEQQRLLSRQNDLTAESEKLRKQEEADKKALDAIDEKRLLNLTNYNRQVELSNLQGLEQLELQIQFHNEDIKQSEERILALQEELSKEELTNERRIELLNELTEAENNYYSQKLSLSKEEKKINDALLKAEEDAKNERIKISLQLLNNAISVFGEQSAVGKAAAVASTTIETYKGAMQAFNAFSGIPIVGPALGIAAAAAATTMGLANIREILKVKTPGGSSVSADISSPALPSFPEQTEAIQETHNNMNEYDVEQLNSTQQRVYVVESDITATQNNVQKARVRATY